MGTTYERIDDRLRAFIEAQPVFFVATAPLAADGSVNLSPKGRRGTLAVLDDLTVAYLDFDGSHAETIAHVRENGRVTLMWCAFEGPPKIVRVHGRGEIVLRDDPRFAGLLPRFGDADGPGLRAIVLVRATRVSDSCGHAVPFLDYRGERTLHAQSLGRRTDEEYRARAAARPFNRESIDGLPALPLPVPPRPTPVPAPAPGPGARPGPGRPMSPRRG